jgi:acetyl-CoA synthetase
MDLEQIAAAFRWNLPQRYNIGVDVCDKWSHQPARVALIHKPPVGECIEYTFTEIRRLSNQAANLMLSAGLRRGDRVAVLLPQAPETAIAHVAIYKIGAIAVPLFSLFGIEALEYRLADSGARAVITDLAGAAKLKSIQGRLPELKIIYTIDGVRANAVDFHQGLS